MRSDCSCGYVPSEDGPVEFSADWHIEHKARHLKVFSHLIEGDPRTVLNLNEEIASKLYQEWEAAFREYVTKGVYLAEKKAEASDTAERSAWAKLVNFVDSHGFAGRDAFDPRTPRNRERTDRLA